MSRGEANRDRWVIIYPFAIATHRLIGRDQLESFFARNVSEVREAVGVSRSSRQRSQGEVSFTAIPVKSSQGSATRFEGGTRREFDTSADDPHGFVQAIEVVRTKQADPVSRAAAPRLAEVEP